MSWTPATAGTQATAWTLGSVREARSSRKACNRRNARNSRDVSHNRDGAGTSETGKPPIGTAKMTVVKAMTPATARTPAKLETPAKAGKQATARTRQQRCQLLQGRLQKQGGLQKHFLGPKRTWNIGGFLYFSFTQKWSKLGILFQIDAYIIEMKRKFIFTPVLLVLGPFSDRA